ncbi:hypothetical protein [Geodermatophilus africanus]|uniref:hypothetical protein n=1 Tax=Geodermatophilus africanus TaxID=1137993 RepID=UPI001114A188|nr:hypothetical protein [Geodermatophilus africanus]
MLITLMASISSRVGTAADVPDDSGWALPDCSSAEPVAARDEDIRSVLCAGAVKDSGRAAVETLAVWAAWPMPLPSSR